MPFYGILVIEIIHFVASWLQLPGRDDRDAKDYILVMVWYWRTTNVILIISLFALAREESLSLMVVLKHHVNYKIKCEKSM